MRQLMTSFIVTATDQGGASIPLRLLEIRRRRRPPHRLGRSFLSFDLHQSIDQQSIIDRSHRHPASPD
jgi:hypothetical protein